MHEKDMGVSQDSFLYPTLFNIKINNIVKSVFNGTDSFLFVDDFELCARGKALFRVERAIEVCVNSVQTWIPENRFIFSNLETLCIHFFVDR